MKLKVKILDKHAKLPFYATEGAAGFDLTSIESVVVQPGQTRAIRTGLAFDIPEGHAVYILPRSGLTAKTKIRVGNAPGLIDEDYSGEVMIIVDNIGELPEFIRTGDRIAQGVLVPVIRATIEGTETLKDTKRGDRGFGHTGR